MVQIHDSAAGPVHSDAKPLVPAVTELRLSGTGMTLGGLILAGIALRTDGFHDRPFYAVATAVLAIGTYAREHRSAPRTVNEVLPPPTPFREALGETVSRIATTTVLSIAVAAALAASFDGWEFAATALSGIGAGMLIASIPLRRWEHEQGSRLLQEPAPFFQINTRPWRQLRPRRSESEPGSRSAPWDATTYYLASTPTKPPRD